MTKSFGLGFAILLGSLSASAACLNPDGMTSKKEIESNKKECLNMAHFTGTPSTSEQYLSEKFRERLVNPKSKQDEIANGSVMYCRYVHQDQNGTSLKFRCARTNESNQLYDTKDQLVSEAAGVVAEGDDFYLVTAKNEKILQAAKEGKQPSYRKANVMKVRATDGGERNVENYTSTAASRILWALGIASHSNIMTEKVVCYGCEKNAFKQEKIALKKDVYAVVEFKDASIEVKYKGDRLYDPTQESWSWESVKSIYQHANEDKKIELEVLGLTTHFLTYTSPSAMQNAIVCTKFSVTNPNQCDEVVAMTHDVGAALGSRMSRMVGNKNTVPRGDITAFKASPVFKAGTCDYAYGNAGDVTLPMKLTKKAQANFLERAQALTHENLKTIFKASHIGNLQNNDASKTNLVEDIWVDAIETRIKEIAQAPCQ